MTERRGRRTGREDAGSLSGDEVEKRLAGGAGLRVMHVRPQPVSVRRQMARDTLTILVAGLVTVLGWQLLGGATGGPGQGSEAPAGTAIAISSAGAAPTLGPLDTLGPIANASIGLGATPTPVPFATLGPTTLTVVVAVTNDDGGNDVASSWTVSIAGGSPSSSVFQGSASGTTITLNPGATFTISTKPKTAGGYVETRAGNCTGPIGKGVSATCTIGENDKPVTMTVKVVVSGGTAKSSSVTVKVVATGLDRAASFAGAPATLMHFSANAGWTITASALAGYTASPPTSGCSSKAGATEGTTLTCTFTFTYVPTPPPTVPPLPSATFSCVPSTGLLLTCTVDSSSGSIDTWQWDWGDGATDSGPGPVAHTYAPGTVSATVKLTVTGPGGSTSTSNSYTLVP